MQYVTAPNRAAHSRATETVLSICDRGVLESTIIQPTRVSGASPILALHGVSRNAQELVDAFTVAAESAGRVVVIPHFTKDKWPVFQRVNRRARPDRALLALLETLRAMDAMFDGPVDLFGFSGGAQLAHRFTMLYPEAVGALHLGAAGWYTFPDAHQVYPYGLADAAGPNSHWPRLMRSGLQQYLKRRFHVYVGECDTSRDESLRQNTIVDQQQGPHRLARAQRFVGALRDQQAAHDIPIKVQLIELANCDHQFARCASHGRLADWVCSAP